MGKTAGASAREQRRFFPSGAAYRQRRKLSSGNAIAKHRIRRRYKLFGAGVSYPVAARVQSSAFGAGINYPAAARVQSAAFGAGVSYPVAKQVQSAVNTRLPHTPDCTADRFPAQLSARLRTKHKLHGGAALRRTPFQISERRIYK